MALEMPMRGPRTHEDQPATPPQPSERARPDAVP